MLFKLNHFISSILTLGLALALSLLPFSAAIAQNPDATIRFVQTLETEGTGPLNPVGLAYSASAGSFFVIENRTGAAALLPEKNVLALNAFAEQTGSTRISDPVEDPINTAYDNKYDRLLIYQPSSGQLLEKPDQASTTTRHDLAALAIENPQGLAVDGATGAVYILDAAGPRILRLAPAAGGDLENARVSVIDLGASGLSALRGIAFDPGSGHLHVYSLADRNLYELSANGAVLANRSLVSFGLHSPQAILFAPSGDQTDDPAEMSLFLADSGLVTGRGSGPRLPNSPQAAGITSAASGGSGQIMELSLAQAPAAAVANFTSSLIKTTDLAAVSPPSPDPSGLAYLPLNNRLIMDDGEVEETVSGITHFQGANVWELTLGGAVLRTANISKVSPTVVPMTNEPTGVAWNPNNNHFYFSDDNSGIDVYDLNPGADGLVGTSDDTWTGFDGSFAGNGDAEGIAYDSWNNSIFVADGVNAEVYQYTLTGSLISHFDVLQYGVVDPESVEFNPDSGTLFVMSSAKSSPVIVETTTTGTLLQTINISVTNAHAAAGLAYGPASDGSGVKRFYIVDRGTDNNSDPNIVDGKMYEVSAPFSGPAPTPTNTFTPGPSPTSTNTQTTTPTITSTPPPSSNPLYISLTSNGTIGGVSFADEDVVRFDGTSWSLFFDGSDVGVGGLDVWAFSILDANTLLMSFDKAITIAGLAIAPQDVVQFNATSLGSNTAGTFSMYLDGSDVGLDASSEGIDAVSWLPDGRVLISTTGNISVPGVSGVDEDIVAFSPTTLGNTTSGTWALYFDGSDVGLADSSNEDVDALDIDPTGAIYLSTLGDFSVPGVSGFDEDVFVCSPTSLGSNTACNYSSGLYFDGSLWGLDANDVDAFSLLSLGPLPTVTPSNTPANTPTTTQTSTPTPTVMATNSPTPTNTPTLGPSPTATNLPTQAPTATATFTLTTTNTPGPTFTPTATFTAPPTPVGSDLIFADDFESGDFSAWSSASTGGGDLSVSPSAALVGSNGMQVVINDTSAIYVTDDTPSAEPHYRARFYFDPNGITMNDGTAHYIFAGRDVSTVFQVDFRFSGGNYQIRVRQYNDGGSVQSTNWVTISDAPHAIEVEWMAATSPTGASNGGITLWIDGVQQASLSGVDNDTRRIESVQMGAVSGIDATTQGTYYLDGFESRRESYIGP